MGKNWKGGRGGGNDLASCRGHGIVVATSDTVREREATKELIYLLEQAIEVIYGPDDTSSFSDEDDEGSGGGVSIQDMLAKELSDLKSKGKAKMHHTTPIRMDTKGLVIVRLNNKKHCPVALLKSIFDTVKKEKLACSRHIIRVVPLQRVFHCNKEEIAAHALKGFKLWVYPESAEEMEQSSKRKFNIVAHDDSENCADLVGKKKVVPENSVPIPQESTTGSDSGLISTEATNVAAAVEAAAVATLVPPPPPKVFALPAGTGTITFGVLFKARNHNVVNRGEVISAVCNVMPAGGTKADYRNPQIRVMVECIKNICGLSIIDKFEEYGEFNLRKFQAECTESGGGTACATTEASEHLINREEA